VALVMRAGATQLVRQNRAVIARPDARPHLPSLRCPTLVLCGEADQLTPPDCAREIAALVPGAHLVMVEGAGHMLTLEQPGRVGCELVQWLSEPSPSAEETSAAAEGWRTMVRPRIER
jgi:pimeloyl-ACP methyl ester carboxylesterase